MGQYKRAEENDIQILSRWQDPTIEDLQEENKKLKDLCDKYEEEHKTTFEEWKKDINIIDELEKYINELLWYDNESDEYRIGTEILNKLNELKGDNK